MKSLSLGVVAIVLVALFWLVQTKEHQPKPTNSLYIEKLQNKSTLYNKELAMLLKSILTQSDDFILDRDTLYTSTLSLQTRFPTLNIVPTHAFRDENATTLPSNIATLSNFFARYAQILSLEEQALDYKEHFIKQRIKVRLKFQNALAFCDALEDFNGDNFAIKVEMPIVVDKEHITFYATLYYIV